MDDLVRRARLAQHDERMSTGALYGELADRIEADAKRIERGVNAELLDQNQAMQERIAELEAALGKMLVWTDRLTVFAVDDDLIEAEDDLRRDYNEASALIEAERGKL
jgi:hypothetical protein